jgi:uncharacterized protein YebE (UPF0316 family)
MDIGLVMSAGWFNWVLMPLMIFFARVFDVSFGTLRVIFISQGFKKIATVVGFFEVLVWILVARQVITNLENFLWIVAYAAGYACGTYVGIVICEKLSIGKVAIRVIIKSCAKEIIGDIKDAGFGVTVLEGMGAHTKSSVIFSIVDLKDAPEVLRIVNAYNPKAFYTIEGVRDVREGTFRKHVNTLKVRSLMPNAFSLRKSK